ncbi:MAG: glycosyltransferase [Bacteroidia bacterium]|jgi:glycosyltransferase involved in cell wall biosynthesis|nr:glycosyltransferase [Bacteroidia bacterium]
MNNLTLPQVLIISTYPPRECGIATYTYDLTKALAAQFSGSFEIIIAAVETVGMRFKYGREVVYTLRSDDSESYHTLAAFVAANERIKLVMIQHEFGLFKQAQLSLIDLITACKKPVLLAFHTILKHPDLALKGYVQELAIYASGVIVMTRSGAHLLNSLYQIPKFKIHVIAHGTHLVEHSDKLILKEQYGFKSNIVLSTFGLLSRGKSIETTIKALPAIVKEFPTVLFLLIGKTHPEVIQNESETYRNELALLVNNLGVTKHVLFVNEYIPVSNLLDYLQLSDVYLFTSDDPEQTVSGTFSYAMASGCPIVSTPIPHAVEVMQQDAGILIPFNDSSQLAEAVIALLKDTNLSKVARSNALHRMASTAWQNSAIAHALLVEAYTFQKITPQYNLPPINLNHIHHLTTEFGILQFANMNQPDPQFGYTLDDNARALIAMVMHYEQSMDEVDLKLITTYLNFIHHCLSPSGVMNNYVNTEFLFTVQNNLVNLDDSNGRAFWALGFVLSRHSILPVSIVQDASQLFDSLIPQLSLVNSTRAIAFMLKGLYYSNLACCNEEYKALATSLANKLERMYIHESENNWLWFEGYLTYANSVLPEGLLCAYLITGNTDYKTTARISFNFLLENTFIQSQMKPVSNNGWKWKGKTSAVFGEQPIDVAYTILALAHFYETFGDESYLDKLEIAFNWFLGDNHLHQIMYNPVTGGCYDGLEEHHVNLNQGAESCISYLLARLTVSQYAPSWSKSTMLSNQMANI